MTKIDVRLHDQWIAERDASRNPNFPDFPTWVAQLQQAAYHQLVEIEGRKEGAPQGGRR